MQHSAATNDAPLHAIMVPSVAGVPGTYAVGDSGGASTGLLAEPSPAGFTRGPVGGVGSGVGPGGAADIACTGVGLGGVGLGGSTGATGALDSSTSEMGLGRVGTNESASCPATSSASMAGCALSDGEVAGLGDIGNGVGAGAFNGGGSQGDGNSVLSLLASGGRDLPGVTGLRQTTSIGSPTGFRGDLPLDPSSCRARSRSRHRRYR